MSTRKRIGLATGYDPNLTVRDFADAMKQIEDRGFELGFFSETFYLMRDSVTALSTFALATRHLTLGATQVVRLRSPVTMAQTLASLDELSGGRIVLCPGSCVEMHMRRHGLPRLDPTRTLTEWIDVIRLVLQGNKVTFRGETLTVEDAELGFKPLRTHIPLWIAATSTTGLRLAGRLGDGVLLNTVASPEYSTNAIRIVREAVEAAGKDWNAFEVAQLINTSIEDDHDAAVDTVRWEIATKFNPASYRTQAGPRMRVGEPHIDPDAIPRLNEAFERGGREALARALPKSMVEGLSAAGTPDEVLARIERYREAGVRLPLVRPAAAHQTQRVIDLFAQR